MITRSAATFSRCSSDFLTVLVCAGDKDHIFPQQPLCNMWKGEAGKNYIRLTTSSEA